ncbi:MAG: hypothetical protein WBW33_06485 [Bryobacteraceae bacterium]
MGIDKRPGAMMLEGLAVAYEETRETYEVIQKQEAARAAGFGTHTLIRWLKIPQFQDDYREVRRATFYQSTMCSAGA